MSSREQDGLGWLSAGVLTLFVIFSSASWSLDLDKQIEAAEQDASAIALTLGREKPHGDSAGEGKRTVKLRLLSKRATRD